MTCNINKKNVPVECCIKISLNTDKNLFESDADL